jgi:EamA domain-containing membrane protein RarD
VACNTTISKIQRSFILTFIDKHCALAEAVKVLKKNIHKKKIWRYAYIFFAMIILKINKGNN